MCNFWISSKKMISVTFVDRWARKTFTTLIFINLQVLAVTMATSKLHVQLSDHFFYVCWTLSKKDSSNFDVFWISSFLNKQELICLSIECLTPYRKIIIIFNSVGSFSSIYIIIWIQLKIMSFCNAVRIFKYACQVTMEIKRLHVQLLDQF